MNATFRLPFLSAVVLTATFALAGCGGSNSTPSTPIPSQTSTASGIPSASAARTVVAYGAPLMQGASFVKRATFGAIGLDVQMTMHDRAGLLAYAKEANDPKNSLYRHWLTPQEIGDRFGASATDYATAVKYFAANHIGTTQYPQREILRVYGKQTDIERTLGVQFGVFKKNGQTFLAPMAAPQMAAALHVAALGNVVRYRVKHRPFLRLSNSYVDGYSPQQIANAFDYTGAYNAGLKGDGITIGVIGTGPITDGDPRFPSGGDVTDYKALFGLTGTGTVVQDIDLSSYSPGNTDGPNGDQYSQSGLASPPPVTSPTATGCVNQGYDPSEGAPISEPGSSFDYTTCNPEDLEAQLDTEQAASMAPDATVNFYIAYNPDECFGTCTSSNTSSQQIGLDISDDEIQQAIADNKSDVITMSFGLDEADEEAAPGYFGPGTNNFGPTEFASLVSEGTAVFASSGDSGAEECMSDTDSSTEDTPCVNYPATDPSVISVGGVNTPLDNSGRLTGPITGWGVATQFECAGSADACGGSGGGCSIYFPQPSYEASVTLANGTSPCSGMRSQPDLALDADTATGVAVVVDAPPGTGGRIIEPVGGTSVAAPEMAAMWALVLQACKQNSTCLTGGQNGSGPSYRLGNPGPYLYAIYGNAAQYAASFYDVLYGNNAIPSVSATPDPSGNTPLDPGFNAGTGYDLVTGIGAPYAKNLATTVVGNVP